jgi:hypothetical protein
MSDTQLYAKFKHTVQCRVEIGDESSDTDWYELDIYSDSEDSSEALSGYLEEEYGDVPKAKGGVFSVEDPDVPFRVVRQYKTA